MRKTLRIALACGLGSMFGATLALETMRYFSVSPWYVLPVACILGGAFAWLVYDLKEVYEIFVSIYRKLCEWKPDWYYWRYVGESWLHFALWSITLALIFPCVALILCALGMDVDVSGVISGSFGVVIGGFVILNMGNFMNMHNLGNMYLGTSRNDMRRITIHLNPIGAGFWILLFTVYFAPRWILRKTTVFATVIWQSVVWLHTHERTLCLMYGTFGAMAGLYFAHPGIGFIMGVISGVMQYRIIQYTLAKK